MEIKSKGNSTKSRVGIFLLLFSIAYSISDRDRYPREYYEWEKREFKKLGMTYMDGDKWVGRDRNRKRPASDKDCVIHKTTYHCRKIRLQGFMHPKEKLLVKRAIGEVNQILKECGEHLFEIKEEVYEYYKLYKQYQTQQYPDGVEAVNHFYTFGSLNTYGGGLEGTFGDAQSLTYNSAGDVESVNLRVLSGHSDIMPWEICRVPVFRHEFLHALGLRHTDYSGSVMYNLGKGEAKGLIYNYSEFDRLMVEMLHNRLMHGGKSEWGWKHDLYFNYFRRPDRRSRGMRLKYPVLYKKDLSEFRKKWEKEQRESLGDFSYEDIFGKSNKEYEERALASAIKAKKYRP